MASAERKLRCVSQKPKAVHKYAECWPITVTVVGTRLRLRNFNINKTGLRVKIFLRPQLATLSFMHQAYRVTDYSYCM